MKSNLSAAAIKSFSHIYLSRADDAQTTTTPPKTYGGKSRQTRLMRALLRSLWLYRAFIISSIHNEFLTRFSRSKLGGLWMIIHPLAQVAIYALILSNILATKLPSIDNKYAYAIYLMAGMLGWNLFSEIVTRCLTLFIEQGNLLKKMRFPRITLPAIVVGSTLLNNALLFLAMLVVFGLLGHMPTLGLLWFFPLTIAVVMLALGIGLILGVVNVFVRDVGQVVPIFLQTLFWFTPIVYPVDIIPNNLQHLLHFNPMLPMINGYHASLVFNTTPALPPLVLTFFISAVLMFFGLFIFRRATSEMVDAL